ncbi:MAG: patatin-like phospholipase family protein [Chloroflexota bacterium]
MLAFVFSGGGARGALQVGALRALSEANIQPDLLVGTSVGAVNAAYLALRGLNRSSIEGLARAWHDAASANLLPTDALGLIDCVLFRGSAQHSYRRLRDFIIAHGLPPDLRFADFHGTRLILVATDLNTGRPVLYGQDPQQSVLEGVLASAAMPPWMPPIEKGEQVLADGGAVSGMPIEAAMIAGATEIIALNLSDPRDVPSAARDSVAVVRKWIAAVGQRQVAVELALAAAYGVPVRHIVLRADPPVALWDFRRTPELIARGYEIARQEIPQWQQVLIRQPIQEFETVAAGRM